MSDIGCGCHKVFAERLWRRVKYEQVACLKFYNSVGAAQHGLCRTAWRLATGTDHTRSMTTDERPPWPLRNARTPMQAAV